MIWSKFIWIIFSNEWIRLFELWRNHQPINDQIIKTWTSSCQRPKLKLLENPRDINSFFADMKSGHFRVHVCVDLQSQMRNISVLIHWTQIMNSTILNFQENFSMKLSDTIYFDVSCWFVDSDCSLLLTKWFFE